MFSSLLMVSVGFFVVRVNFFVKGDTLDFAVRLNNSFGNNSREGRLEIYYSGRWGTVCNNGFTNTSARVACASLGFAYNGAVLGNSYGGGMDPIWLDNVKCAGTETGIEQCVHNGWDVHNCGHTKDVSISCECGDRHFPGSTGKITSPNFPLSYPNNLDCYNYIRVTSGHAIIITFLAFRTDPSSDWVTVTCESGKTFRSQPYSGSELPSVLTITSCNFVNVSFHTNSYTTSTGFSLTYNITSDTVVGGFTTKPSNAFPRSDKNDVIIFNCTTTTKYFPWWTLNAKRNHYFFRNLMSYMDECHHRSHRRRRGDDPMNYTITNSTCGVINSVPYSLWFRTESLGPGSCNLIVAAPGNDLNKLEGSLLCTDSTLSTARAILAPIDLQLSSNKGINFLTTVTDIIMDEEMKISCNPSFTDWDYDYDDYGDYWNKRSSLDFTYRLYNLGPVVRMSILRTYLTSQGNVVSSTNRSGVSSYALVKAPKDGIIPRYTCNIVFDSISNISDIKINSEVSFSTEPVEVSYWATADNMTIIGDSNGHIKTPSFLYCNVPANPPATYTWIDESSGSITNGPIITVHHGGRYTCNASNVVRGKYYQVSKSINLQDDTFRMNLILGTLFGAAVLSIIILSAILLISRFRQHKPSSAPNVGHEFDENGHELHQEEGEDNVCTNGLGNAADVDEYENLETLRTAIPATYEKVQIRK